MTNYHIIGLQASNFKRLKAVNIRPDRSLVEVRGRNGQGKSSVLDALWVALAGKAAAPAVPIRNGAEEARIRLDLGRDGVSEIVVVRTFKHGRDGEVTTDLKVTEANGSKLGSPQTMLDKLVGSLTFDPLAFARMEPKQQFDELRRLVPGVDFDAIERAHKGDYDRRTEVNNSAKRERAAAAVIVVPEGTPTEPADLTALDAELEAAGKANVQLAQRRANRERVSGEVTAKNQEAQRLDTRAAQLRAEADQLTQQAETIRAEAAGLQEQLATAAELPAETDTTAIRLRIETARRTNENVAKASQKAAHIRKAIELEAQSEAITLAMAVRQEDKVKQIAAAKLPVAGIGFGDGVVLLNDLPFAQASDAEQLRASIAIAAATNGQLKVIRVRDGSLLDADSLAMVGQFAAEHGLQVWMEIVDSKGETGVVIEDGMVRDAAVEAAA